MSLFNFIKFSSTTAGTHPTFPLVPFPHRPSKTLETLSFPLHAQRLVYGQRVSLFTQVYNNSSVSTHDIPPPLKCTSSCTLMMWTHR